VIDTLTHNFLKGESIVENAIHLWNLVVTDDVPKSEDQLPWWGSFLANSRLEKALTRSVMLQLVLSRLSLFLDQLLLLERLSGSSSIAASLKSIMSYIY
jgi:hypothetical protein